MGLDQFLKVGQINDIGKNSNENVYIKGQTVHGITRPPTLADYTGLEVDLFNGTPGLYSAR